mmetsp:Transcript_25000/g.61600  ORF Transcript_25000/g.61600 Transcript_25000/m.61600 type:complete len:106 (-) Transcript_25000:568-885(-)
MRHALKQTKYFLLKSHDRVAANRRSHSNSYASRKLIDVAPPEMDQSAHTGKDCLTPLCSLTLSGTPVRHSRFRFYCQNVTLRIDPIYSTSKSDLKTGPNDDGRPK